MDSDPKPTYHLSPPLYPRPPSECSDLQSVTILTFICLSFFALGVVTHKVFLEDHTQVVKEARDHALMTCYDGVNRAWLEYREDVDTLCESANYDHIY